MKTDRTTTKSNGTMNGVRINKWIFQQQLQLSTRRKIVITCVSLVDKYLQIKDKNNNSYTNTDNIVFWGIRVADK